MILWVVNVKVYFLYKVHVRDRVTSVIVSGVNLFVHKNLHVSAKAIR